jgi:hypothetical protein
VLNNPEVLAASISGGATITAALLAAIAAAIIGKKFAGREKLKSDLETAKKDIEFLLAVERRHCELHRERDGKSNRNLARKHVRENEHLKWSKLFYPIATQNET